MKAILYGRFSPRPDDDLCESADKQLERCRAWCSAMRHQVVAEFKDEALSGATMDGRPGLLAAITRAKLERGTLVVSALDRLSRRTRDILSISEDLTNAGASWASLSESIDTKSPSGECVVTIFAAMAQMQRRQIQLRTREGMQRLQASGWAMSKRLPSGTRLADEQPTEEHRKTTRGMPPKALRLVIEPTEVASLQLARELRNAGYSWRKVATELDSRGIQFRGKPWNHATLFKILRKDSLPEERSPS